MKLAQQPTDKLTQATLTGKQQPTFLRILSILTSALAVMALATASFAQLVPPNFVNPTLFNGSAFIRYGPVPVAIIAVGDFNNDGVPDLVTFDADGAVNGWSIILGNGDGTFQPPVSIAPFAGLVGSIVTGDFNNDGNLDFAVTYGSSGGAKGTLSIFLGNGAGGFTLKASYAELGVLAYNDQAGGLVATDLRGNGHLDLIAMDPQNQGIDVFLGNGDGTFGTPTLVGVPASGYSGAITAGDVNNDGKPDLVVASNVSLDGIYVLIGNGDGTFKAPVFYLEGDNSGAMAVAIGKLTKTSHGDVVLGAGSGVFVFTNNGDGTFQTPPAYFAGPAWADSIVLADVNGDKKLDVVTSSYTSSSVWVLLGTGKAGKSAFTVGGSFATDGLPNNVVVADFNGDKKLDYATSNGHGQWVTVGLGNGDGTFRASQGYGYGWSNPINAMATADLNGDGFPDIVTGGGGDGTGIAVQLGSSHGALGNTISTAVGPCGGESNGNRNGVNSIALGDANGDKKIDVVTTSINDGPSCVTNQIGVLAGLGNGKFKAPVFYSTGVTVQSYSATLANLRGAGKLDIVVSNGDGSLSVLLNNGKGVFGAATVIPAASGSDAGGIVAGDFNNDGKLDIAITNYSGTAINVLLGNGDGTFQAPIVNPSPINPVGLTAGDFNNDGKLDLALTSWNDGGSLVIFTGHGNGTFTAGTTYNFGTWEACYPSGGSNPYWIGAADLNQDGKLDLAIATTYSYCGTEYSGESTWGEALVYTGNGDGTFTLDDGPWLAGGEGATGIALADFNGDGMTDMAVATTALWTTQEWVSILQNKTQPVSVSPLNMTFKTQTMGTTSKAQTVIFTNDEANTLAVSGVSLGGADPGDFGYKSACGSTLLSGANCTISVTFKPTAAGKRTAALQITDGAGTQSVALTGTGR